MMTNAKSDKSDIIVSVVMPCLNEEASIQYCIEKALIGIKKTGLRGEVVVSDNGSTDRSVAIAKKAGARVVHQPLRGYGNAYRMGFTEARGKYIVMGDSDKTYDFTDLPKFINPLRKGYDMVMGTRLKGKIMPGAMPWLHQHIGNPMLSKFLNILFNTHMSDSHCGMRAFTKDAFERMHLKTTGMEFASEMVINASKAGLKIKEVPITLYANTDRKPHLRSFRDGWRHIRFMILYSPFHLFFLPGFLLLLIGFLIMASLLIAQAHVFGFYLGPISALFASLFILVGFQIIILGYFSKLIYAKVSAFEKDKKFTGALKIMDSLFAIEHALIVAVILFIIGFILDLFILVSWITTQFGPLSLMHGVVAITGVTFIFLSLQIMFSSFFAGILASEYN